jgi:hypothetical protein
LDHRRAVEDLHLSVLEASMPMITSGASAAGTGGGEDDSALAYPDGWVGANGRYISHVPVPGVGGFTVLQVRAPRAPRRRRRPLPAPPVLDLNEGTSVYYVRRCLCCTSLQLHYSHCTAE